MKKFIIIYLILFLMGIGGYGYYSFLEIEKTVGKMYEPIDEEDIAENKPLIIQSKNKELKKKTLTFLLLGNDQRGNERGRSDAIIVATVNPNTNKVTLVSVPRDTKTELVGLGTQDKINHAYAFGGPKMIIDSVEKFLDIEIDYYTAISMRGFVELVDLMGGVAVENSFSWEFYDEDFTKETYNFQQGSIDLNGEEALIYARMRKVDPRGDFGRNERQKQIIRNLINKAKNPTILTKLDDILNIMGDYIRTNLTFEEIVLLQRDYGDAGDNIESIQINGKDNMINGIYYHIVNEEERLRVSSLLKKEIN